MARLQSNLKRMIDELETYVMKSLSHKATEWQPTYSPQAEMLAREMPPRSFSQHWLLPKCMSNWRGLIS